MAKRLQFIGDFPSNGTVDPSKVEEIVDKYLQENAPSGEPGKDGLDGISPTVSVKETDLGYMVTITDATGIHSFEVFNGTDGQPGEANYEQVQQLVVEYLDENPPVPRITINGEEPDENGNFNINVQTGETNNVVEF